MKKFQANKTSIKAMVTIMLMLLILVTLFSPNSIFAFLSNGIYFLFGFVGYWIILPFLFLLCFYSLLTLKKDNSKKRINILIGLLFLILFFVILFSFKKDLTFDNFYSNFLSTYANSLNTLPTFELGGGFVGYFLCGALITLIKPIGVLLFLIILCLIAIILITFNAVQKIIQISKEKKQIYKEADEKLAQERILEQVEKPEPIEEVSSQNDVEKMSDNFTEYNEQVVASTIKKAHLVLNSNNYQERQETENVNINFEKKTCQEADTNFKEAPINSNNFENIVVNNSFVEQPINATVSELISENNTSNNPTQADQPRANLIKNYVYPPIDLLQYHENANDKEINESYCEERTNKINQIFSNFKIGAKVAGHTVGPSVTRFDIEMDPSCSVTTINKYIKDIASRLGGVKVRFEEIVPGKITSGLEIPNNIRTTVGLKEAIESMAKLKLNNRHIPFGKDISGELKTADFADFPHLLVSGTTGSGKSIFVHTAIISLLMRNNPDQLRLMLIDPKKVEMGHYEGVPHLLCPVIIEPKKAYVALQKLVDEMERRFNLFQKSKMARDIKSFNKYAEMKGLQPLPYIVVVVDEYADLVDSEKEIKNPIHRIAQKARAAGIHLFLATQRPSVDIIDGVIKSNISNRVALLSASVQDSMVIIGEGGAEELLGHGDMLVQSPIFSTSGNPRVQGCFVDTDEMSEICNFLRARYKVEYNPYFLNLEQQVTENKNDQVIKQIDKSQNEEIQYQQIKEQVCSMNYCSISFIQRTFGMGYPRAGRIFNRLINEGIVQSGGGDAKGSRVLVHSVSNEQQIGSIEQSEFIPDEEENV